MKRVCLKTAVAGIHAAQFSGIGTIFWWRDYTLLQHMQPGQQLQLVPAAITGMAAVVVIIVFWRHTCLNLHISVYKAGDYGDLHL